MVGEFDLIDAFTPLLASEGPGLPLGPGDDAAVIEVEGVRLILAVDTLVDRIHFDLGISDLADVGWKALAANVSDVAAVGGVPTAALVSLQRPEGFDEDDAKGLFGGLRAAADRWGCRLVGGDTTGGPCLAVSVSIIGTPVHPRRLLRRDAAEPGHVVIVVGPLGLAAAGLALAKTPRHDLLAEHPDLLAAHRRPEPQLLAAAPLVLGGAKAGIDVSDGLGRDLGHIAEMSEVAIRIEAERLPVHAGVLAVADALDRDPLDWVVGGGDDYALAVTVPAEDLPRVEVALEGSGLRGRMIGTVTEGSGVTLVGSDGSTRDVAKSGWEHR